MPVEIAGMPCQQEHNRRRLDPGGLGSIPVREVVRVDGSRVLEQIPLDIAASSLAWGSSAEPVE